MNGVPEPAAVSSAEQLAAAAKQLKESLSLSGAELVRATGLSAGTISELINGKAFPREDTFEIFIRGCGQPWRPWQLAWARAQGESRRVRRAEQLTEELEETQRLLHETRDGLASAVRRIAELEERLNDASLILAASTQAIRDDHGWALAWLQPKLDLLGPIRAHPRSVLYDPRPVDEFLFELRELARTSLQQARDYLKESPELLPLSEPEAFGYDRGQVEESLAALRRLVGRTPA